MSLRFYDPDDATYGYLLDHSPEEAPILQRLREATAPRPDAIMQTPPEAGHFLYALVRMLGARRAIEVGIYTGYSSLCIAAALPADGYLLACDLDADATDLAREFWEEAGVADRVDLRIAPALDTLDAELAAGGAGTYDFVFLDADKENYAAYYDRALALLREGGVLVVDNVLWAGRVADPAEQDGETIGIRALNDRIRADRDVVHAMLPVADGMSVVLKPAGPSGPAFATLTEALATS